MHRFFVPFPLTTDLILTEEAIMHQLTRVLRAQVGEYIILFDGDGSETEYEIEKIEKKSVKLRWIKRRFPDTEAKKSIILYQALPNKIEKIEYILQKWVEVGIQKFIFFRSDRSQKLIISDSKIERFHVIVREAVEQCGGVKLPEIYFWWGIWGNDSAASHIVLDTVSLNRSLQECTNTQNIGLWVGPEWWWSDRERDEMRDNGFIFAHFSDRVMRTETAWVVVSFALLNA